MKNKVFTRWLDPYIINNNKRSYNIKYNGSGVYLIKENNVVVYVGRSKKNLTNTLYRHFQRWTDKRVKTDNKGIARVTYYNKNISDYKVKAVFSSDVEYICALEELLIKKLEPRDNKLKASAFGYKYKKVVKSKLQEEAGF